MVIADLGSTTAIPGNDPANDGVITTRTHLNHSLSFTAMRRIDPFHDPPLTVDANRYLSILAVNEGAPIIQRTHGNRVAGRPVQVPWRGNHRIPAGISPI